MNNPTILEALGVVLPSDWRVLQVTYESAYSGGGRYLYHPEYDPTVAIVELQGPRATIELRLVSPPPSWLPQLIATLGALPVGHADLRLDLTRAY